MTDGIEKDWFALNPAKFTEKELVSIIEILHSFNVPEYEADNRESGLTEAHSDIRTLTSTIEELLERRIPQVGKARGLMIEALEEMNQYDYWTYDRLMMIPVFNDGRFLVRVQITYDCRQLIENIKEGFGNISEVRVSEDHDEAGFVTFECVVSLRED